jgi:sugar phosphate isomerase/epimerase
MALIVGSKIDTNTRAPLTSIVVDLYHLFIRGQAKITEIKEHGEEKISHVYKTEEK